MLGWGGVSETLPPSGDGEGLLGSVGGEEHLVEIKVTAKSQINVRCVGRIGRALSFSYVNSRSGTAFETEHPIPPGHATLSSINCGSRQHTHYFSNWIHSCATTSLHRNHLRLPRPRRRG